MWPEGSLVCILVSKVFVSELGAADAWMVFHFPALSVHVV